MSELSSHLNSIPSPVFDVVAIEARLNALAGPAEPDLDPVELETSKLRDQFLADTSLCYLGSRLAADRNDAATSETLVEFHRIEFQPNQTRAILHLGFRPDFSLAPTVEATLIDACGRVRITSSTTFGARIEITLSNSNSDVTTICIETVCKNLPNE